MSVVTGVLPARDDPPPSEYDARSAALAVFKAFLATLRFMRQGNEGGEPEPFKIPPKNILTDWPDGVKDLKFPSLAFLPSRGVYDQFGLGPAQLQEETIDRYAPGTGVLHVGDYLETFTVESWTTKIPERRAISSAVETAMMSAADGRRLRFRLPEYFDVAAAFSLEERVNIDDADAVRNRRRGHVYIQLEVPVVRLVNLKTLRPYVKIEVVEETELASS